MDFSVMFWGDTSASKNGQEAYRLVRDVATYADKNGYSAVWLPERHFHPWGGSHPNPSILAAALATITNNIRLRAGSVVLPLHHPIRVAEEWSVVDNLSGGRVELAVATGWKDDDFILAPEKYAKRREDVWKSLDTLQSLWRGEKYAGTNGSGKPVEVATYPRPVQPELPIWITSSGALRTMANAGGAGFNLLTHLLGQDYATVEKKVVQYKAYRVRNGFKNPGKVALMIHTFLGTDKAKVKETVKAAMSSYLLNSADLTIPSEKRSEWEGLDQATKNNITDIAFERYFETASLMGTTATCKPTIKRLMGIGVTDVCCLVDFGLKTDAILESMQHLTELKDWCASNCAK